MLEVVGVIVVHSPTIHLGPLGLVARLEAPRPVEVLGVVAVVLEVRLEARVVVLPDLGCMTFSVVVKRFRHEAAACHVA